MKQIASHLEEDITAKRQNIVHINTIISNKAAANLLRSYLKETDMETNFEMFDVARLAESLPHFYVYARTKSGDLFKTTTQKKKFEEIYNENLRINQNCTIIST
jgi:phosphoribosylaminoimidazole-succinocarboxamide synthase